MSLDLESRFYFVDIFPDTVDFRQAEWRAPDNWVTKVLASATFATTEFDSLVPYIQFRI